jgi:SAM-dependent methyltransferase
LFSARDRFFKTTKLRFNLAACRGCDCLFIDPLPDTKDLAMFYPRHYWSGEAPGFLKSCERTYRRLILRGHMSSINRAASGVVAKDNRPVRLLDVGCGSGLLIGLLKQQGFDVVGFDSSESAVGVAESETGVKVVTGRGVNDAGFAAASFDLVTLFHVIEHTADPRGTLDEVRRILQPRGRLLVQVPNIASWQSRLCGPRWYGLDVPRHVVNYSGRAIRRLLSDCGFQVRRTCHFNLRDNAAALASSVCPGLDPVSRRARSESSLVAWTKHLAYVGVVVAGYPLVVAESLCGAGGTVMLEAEKI